MKNNLFLSVLSFILLSNISGQNNDQIFDEYYYSGFHTGAKIILDPDYTFIYSLSSFSCVVDLKKGASSTTLTEIVGTYKVDGNSIKLNPTRYFNKNYQNEKYVLLNKDSILKKGFITEYEFCSDRQQKFIFRKNLSSIYYLKEHNDFINLANHYNSTGDFYRGELWSNMKQDELRSAEIDFKKVFPEKWKHLILDTIIITNVISIDSLNEIIGGRNKKIYSLNLNKGKKDGIFKGMKLYGQCPECIKEKNSFNSCNILIYEADESVSKGRLRASGYGVKCENVIKYTTIEISKK